MSMTEMTEHMSGQDFSKMMNPPLPHDGEVLIYLMAKDFR